VPTAPVGGLIVLDEHLYKSTTGVVLLLAGAAMILQRELAADADRDMPRSGAVTVGAIVGLVSGLTGVGGRRLPGTNAHRDALASSRQTAALSAPFILANSVS
jgi:uncharacterized protein